MDYYSQCLKREECYKCMQEPLQFKMDYFKKCQEKKMCNDCVQLPAEHYFNQMPSNCGPNVEYSCMNTSQYCPQHNANDYEWIFSQPNKYNALMELRNILYPENCFLDDEFVYE